MLHTREILLEKIEKISGIQVLVLVILPIKVVINWEVFYNSLCELISY